MDRISFMRFRTQLKPYGVFSTHDILKSFPSFDKRRLYEWSQKGYIIKLKNDAYRFTDIDSSWQLLCWIANKIHTPSYISLTFILFYYGFIPEAVFQITSVSTNKTKKIETPDCYCDYKHIKPSLFFGYKIIYYNSWPILLAEPEKALLDYFYLNPKLTETQDAIRSMRFNFSAIKETIDLNKMNIYLKSFNSLALDKRIKMLMELIYA